MIETIAWRTLPFMASNRLFLDYVEGNARALSYYTHGPTDFRAALGARQAHEYPRTAVTELLQCYNQSLGGSERTLANIAALGEPDVYCVVGGQQAGFLGGPAYVAYKIDCTIQLATRLSDDLGVRVVPVFWLASEDHDFGEVNHAHYVQADGEIGRVSFDWTGKGRPIADMPVTEQVTAALDTYWSSAQPGPHAENIRALTSPSSARYCDWLAALWLKLYAEDGLVVVEPATLRPAAGDLFRFALENREAIGDRLGKVAAKLTDDGYTPLLAPETAGVLYTFAENGQRVRVQDPAGAASEAEEHPERFSTDAALRPLLADSVLPVIASTLGAGELAYQGMLRPLYELLQIPQPICFPRKSYTFVTARQSERLAAYGLRARDILTSELDIDAVMHALMPSEELERFAQARAGVEAALSPLKSYVERLDPNLGRSWEQALSTAQRNIDKLEERAINVTLARGGFARRELQSLRNVLVPRGRLQERVLPITHFLQHHGPGFLQQLRGGGELERFEHAIVTLEDEHA
ncbi:MAG: bacillithiol biosynthesis cysteine-adding enzyme BshC [Anaerolineae bacterium]